MKSLKQSLDELSQSNFQNASHPRFGKDVDPAYSKGYTKGYIWIDAMCNYYFDMDKALIAEFKRHLLSKLKEVEELPPSKYKEGLYSSLEKALKSLD